MKSDVAHLTATVLLSVDVVLSVYDHDEGDKASLAILQLPQSPILREGYTVFDLQRPYRRLEISEKISTPDSGFLSAFFLLCRLQAILTVCKSYHCNVHNVWWQSLACFQVHNSLQSNQAWRPRRPISRTLLLYLSKMTVRKQSDSYQNCTYAMLSSAPLHLILIGLTQCFLWLASMAHDFQCRLVDAYYRNNALSSEKFVPSQR